MTDHEKVLAQKIGDLETFLNSSEKYARTGTLGKTFGHPKVGVVLEKLSGNLGLFVGGVASTAALFSAFHFVPGLAGVELNAIEVGVMLGITFVGPATPIAASMASRILDRYSSTNEMDGINIHKIQKAIQFLKKENHPKLNILADQASQLFSENKTILAFWDRFAYKTNALIKQMHVIKQQSKDSKVLSETPAFLTPQSVLVARATAGIDCNKPLPPSEKIYQHSKM